MMRFNSGDLVVMISVFETCRVTLEVPKAAMVLKRSKNDRWYLVRFSSYERPRKIYDAELAPWKEVADWFSVVVRSEMGALREHFDALKADTAAAERELAAYKAEYARVKAELAAIDQEAQACAELAPSIVRKIEQGSHP